MTYVQKTSFSNKSKKQLYNNYQFDSNFEASYAMELDTKVKEKEIKSWRPHVKIPLIVNDYRICEYEVDFEVTHNDGTTEYIETKGLMMSLWKFKWSLFEAIYSGRPDVTLTVVKQGKFHIKK